MDWTIEWMIDDENSREQLLQDVRRSALTAAGHPLEASQNEAVLSTLLSGIQGRISGKPINEMEQLI